MRYKVGDLVGMPNEEMIGFDFLFIFGVLTDEKPKEGRHHVLRTIQPTNRLAIQVYESEIARVIVSFAGPVLLEGIG